MRDLHRLLEESAHVPRDEADSDRLWERGRARRRRAQLAAGGAVAAVAAAITLAVVLTQPPGVDIAPVGSSPDADPSQGTPTSDDPSPSTIEPDASETASPRSTRFTEAQRQDGVLTPVELVVDGPPVGTVVASVSLRDGHVELRRFHPDGGGERFRVTTSDPSVTLSSLAVAPDGSIGFEVAGEDGAGRVLLLDPGADAPFAVAAATGRRQVELVGAADLDGQAALLVAEGEATSLSEDAGTDIVAYWVADEQVHRQVVLVDAAAAWEGGVASADLRDGWLVWDELGTTTHTIWVTAIASAGDRTQLLQLDPEAGEAEPVDVALVPRPDTARPPVAGVLLHHRAGYPDEPSAELVTFDLPVLDVNRYTIDGIGWEAGLPAGLDRFEDGWVVSRTGEGWTPRAPLVGTPGSWRTPDLGPLDLEGLVRSAR